MAKSRSIKQAASINNATLPEGWARMVPEDHTPALRAIAKSVCHAFGVSLETLLRSPGRTGMSIETDRNEQLAREAAAYLAKKRDINRWAVASFFNCTPAAVDARSSRMMQKLVEPRFAAMMRKLENALAG